MGIAFPAQVALGGGRTSGSVDSGGDDETIGTLPIVGNQGQQLALVRRMRDTRPDFYLQGAYDELLATIISFTGTGTVTLQTLTNGEVRLGFHGQLELELDRGLLHATGIQIGGQVSAAFLGAEAWSGFPGQIQPMRNLQPGELTLPVTALDGLGVLEGNPWVLGAQSTTNGGYLFHAIADGAVLYVGQTY